jgi:hypothetical protein
MILDVVEVAKVSDQTYLNMHALKTLPVTLRSQFGHGIYRNIEGVSDRSQSASDIEYQW